ncbi:MAG: QueT transporter family protein [Eubacteriales bacterium]|nr:QueT transporter family protein [Eubacteriales bacterium]MCI6971161.1 QueT transporter family protein [Eubacterium sp.]MDD7573719.1 QueT transporter family protein [Eubacteriales bacterium]MDY5355483.1 QueT transporter family protein [Eubacteriales bacterium]
MKNRKILFMTQGALIAALYVAFSFIAYSFGLSGNAVVQMRLSEMLTVLPAFMPAAIPGLAIGCLLTNLLTGCAVWDVIFGTLATLLGAIGTFLLRKNKWLAPLPPILANTMILPPVLATVYGGATIPVFILTVGLGEIVCCGILGEILVFFMKKYQSKLKFY